MNYVILGKVVPSVEASLSRGESMFTQSGGMFYQTEGIKMETNTNGGLLKGIGRMFAG
ncbi:AIM24 family protein, partial [Terrisporobacter petrolearius]